MFQKSHVGIFIVDKYEQKCYKKLVCTKIIIDFFRDFIFIQYL